MHHTWCISIVDNYGGYSPTVLRINLFRSKPAAEPVSNERDFASHAASRVRNTAIQVRPRCYKLCRNGCVWRVLKIPSGSDDILFQNIMRLVPRKDFATILGGTDHLKKFVTYGSLPVSQELDRATKSFKVNIYDAPIPSIGNSITLTLAYCTKRWVGVSIGITTELEKIVIRKDESQYGINVLWWQ